MVDLRQRRRTKSAQDVRTSNLNLTLQNIEPKTQNQIKTFRSYRKDNHLLLIGSAGTGKTFISIFLAMKEILESVSDYKKLIIIRNAQSAKEIGFLPGDEKKKLEVYEVAYRSIFSELFKRDDAYEILKQKGIVEFTSTSFLRGQTLDNCIVLVDEIQNQRYNELRTVITRLGDNSRLIMSGDSRQDDLTSVRYNEVSGLPAIVSVIKRMSEIDIIEFTTEDIVRSGLVKSFIIAEQSIDF